MFDLFDDGYSYFLVPSLAGEFEKMMSFSQKYRTG